MAVTPSASVTPAPTNGPEITSPHLHGGRLPPALARHLLREDMVWAGKFMEYLHRFGSAPNVPREEPFWGGWMNHLRNIARLQTPSRLLAVHTVLGFATDMKWLALWMRFMHLAVYGQEHGHIYVPQKKPLGMSVSVLRRAWRASQGATKPVDSNWYPWFQPLLEKGLPGWVWHSRRGRHIASRDAYIESMKVKTFTPEHKAMQRWAKAYAVRSAGVPFFLLTPDELLNALGPDVTGWLAGLVDSPDAVAALPEYMRYAVAQLMLAPPAEIWPDTLPGNWLPDGCIGLATQRLAHLRNLPLHHGRRPST